MFMEINAMQPIHKGDEQNMTLIDFLLQLLTFALTTLPLFMTNTIFFHFLVKPNPANVTLKPVDPHTIEVHFMIHHNVAYFKPGFSQLIRFKSELDPDWISMNETDLNSEATDHLVKLEDLIPFAEYTVEFKYISRVVSHKVVAVAVVVVVDTAVVVVDAML
jgi:hypothetical protein